MLDLVTDKGIIGAVSAAGATVKYFTANSTNWYS